MLGFKCLISLNPHTILIVGIITVLYLGKRDAWKAISICNQLGHKQPGFKSRSTVHIVSSRVQHAFLSEDREHKSFNQRVVWSTKVQKWGWLAGLHTSLQAEACLHSDKLLFKRVPSLRFFQRFSFLSSLTLPLLSISSLLLPFSQFLDSVSL